MSAFVQSRIPALRSTITLRGFQSRASSVRGFATLQRPAIYESRAFHRGAMSTMFNGAVKANITPASKAYMSMGSSSGGSGETMIAYRFAPGSSKPAREEVSVPHPKPNEVLVKILAGGVCHSDVGVLDPDHNLSTVSNNHYTLGHEGAGEITALGSSVAATHPDLKVGTYIAVYGANGCFEASCRECSSGMDNLCPNTSWIGLGRDGSWAGYAAIPASSCVPVPGTPTTIAPAVVAVATDAVLTPYHALKACSRVQPGQTVLCLGVGGLGLNGVEIAKNCLGATVIACDTRHSSLNQAKELGADIALTPDALIGYVKEHKLSIDVVADFCGTQQTFDLASQAVAPGGIVHIVGLMQPTIQITPLNMMAKDMTVKVSFWGCKHELVEVLQAIKDGKIHPHVQTRPLEDCEKVLEEMIAGKLKSRIALVPSE